jgi:hypothetical protein
MWYKELPNLTIKLQPKQEVELDLGEGKILIPTTDTRIFLHWYNEKGKLINSHQLKYSTLVRHKVKLVNPENKDAVILQIDTPPT